MSLCLCRWCGGVPANARCSLFSLCFSSCPPGCSFRTGSLLIFSCVLRWFCAGIFSPGFELLDHLSRNLSSGSNTTPHPPQLLSRKLSLPPRASPSSLLTVYHRYSLSHQQTPILHTTTSPHTQTSPAHAGDQVSPHRHTTRHEPS